MAMNGVEINFDASDRQGEAWELLIDNTTDFVGYGGAAFSGKSFLLCYWITSMAISYPGTVWGIGRRQLTVLKKTTLVTLFKVFSLSKITKDLHYTFNQTQNTITLKTKQAKQGDEYNSVIYLLDTAMLPSDPLYERFGGLELTGCAIDESAETPHQAVEILSTRIGRAKNAQYGIHPKLLETFNPSKGHVYSRYYKPYKAKQETPETKFIKALPSDNPSPEVPAYVNRILKSGSKITIERLIKGNFDYDDSPDALISFDKIEDLFTNTPVHKEGATRYISADVARMGSDKAIIWVWAGYEIIDMVEFDMSKITLLQQTIYSLRAKHNVAASNTIVDEDGVGGGLVDNLHVKGFINNSSALKGENYYNLKSQCYYKYAEKVSQNGIFINCELSTSQIEAIKEEHEQIKSWKTDIDGKLRIIPKEEVKEILGHSPDYTDGLMMRMWFDIRPVAPRTEWLRK